MLATPLRMYFQGLNFWSISTLDGCTTPLQKENVFNFKILNLALLNLQKENVFNFCFIQYGTESLAVLIFMK